MTDDQTVTQEARDAAARFTQDIGARTGSERAAMLNGYADDDCYVTFAADLLNRHRTAHSGEGRSNGAVEDALASIIHANGPVVIDFMGEGIGWRPLDYGTWAQLAIIPIAPILIASRRTWAYAAGRDHSRAVDSRAGGADQHNPHSLNQPYERFCWTLGWEETIAEDAALAQPEAGGE